MTAKLAAQIALVFLLVLILLLPMPLTAQTNSRSSAGAAADEPQHGFGIGASASTLGIGAEAGVALTPKFNLRGGFHIFNHDRSFTRDGINYQSTFNLRSGSCCWIGFLRAASFI